MNISTHNFEPTTSAGLSGEGSRVERDLLRGHTGKLQEILETQNIAIRVTLGAKTLLVGDPMSADQPAELVFKSRDHFVRLFQKLRLYDFAMAYVAGTIEVRGPLVSAVKALDAMNIATDRKQTMGEYLRLWFFRASKALFPSIALRFESLDHYSQSAQAYELFLDKYMQYTCGRFETGEETIDAAQVAKFELIRSLAQAHLGPLAGKKHLDIGCGWGGLVGYFQDNYGTSSIGNTNCRPQMKYARKRFNCEVVFGDFIELNKQGGKFDLITVVGMAEHLTPARRSQLFSTIQKLLSDDGVMYLQCIAKPTIWIGGDAYRLAEQEVFKGHYLEYREETEARLKRHGFEIVDAFDHGRDYGFTTALWVEKIERNREALIELLGEQQYRLYVGYLAFGSRLFSTGRGSLMRYLLKKQK